MLQLTNSRQMASGFFSLYGLSLSLSVLQAFYNDKTIVSPHVLNTVYWLGHCTAQTRNIETVQHRLIHTQTHTRLTALFPWLPKWAGTRKVKPIWIWLKQETVAVESAVCTSLQTDNYASTPPLSLLQAGCPSCHPTNSIKSLKATQANNDDNYPCTMRVDFNSWDFGH